MKQVDYCLFPMNANEKKKDGQDQTQKLSKEASETQSKKKEERGSNPRSLIPCIFDSSEARREQLFKPQANSCSQLPETNRVAAGV